MTTATVDKTTQTSLLLRLGRLLVFFGVMAAFYYAFIHYQQWMETKKSEEERAAVASTVIQQTRDKLSDSDPWVRYKIIMKLHSLGQDAISAVPEVIRLARDPNPYVRFAAIKFLGKPWGEMNQQVILAVATGLSDEDEAVRSMAITALKRIGTKEAIDLVNTHEKTRF